MFEDVKKGFKKVAKKTVEGSEKIAKAVGPKIEKAAQVTGDAVTKAIDTAKPHVKNSKDKIVYKVKSGELKKDMKEFAEKSANVIKKAGKKAKSAIDDFLSDEEE